MLKQLTIKHKKELSGIGLHKGKNVKLTIEPLDPNSGIIFYRSDLKKYIPLKEAKVLNTNMATVIGINPVCSISTVEHFLSAIYAYGIDNILITVDSDELPVMDGSAASYCILLDEANLIEQSKNKKIMKIAKEVKVIEGDKYSLLKPSNDLNFNFKIDFEHPMIRRQSYDFKFNKEKYTRDIARARTFGFLEELEYLKKHDLAKGGSLDNCIVLDGSKVLNPEGLRFDDEFVRHKILDAIGDMALLGVNFLGTYESFAGSHKLNNKLTVETLNDPNNFELVELSREETKELALAYSYEKS